MKGFSVQVHVGAPRESKTSTRESSAKGVRQGIVAKAAAKAVR